MSNDTIGGFVILHRAILKPLLDDLKGKGKSTTKYDVYFYLLYYANYSDQHRIKKKGEFKVVESYGCIAISVADLANYFDIERNTVSKRLQALEKDGFISKIKNANICNVYKIVNYGDAYGTFEQRFEQPQNKIEQNFEQPNSKEIYRDIDNFEESFEQRFEQPQNKIEQNFEQHNINNNNQSINNNLSTTIYNSYTHEEKILNSVSNDRKFWITLKKKYNIDPEYIERKFDNFCIKQLEENASIKSEFDCKKHFVSWLEKILKQNYGTEIFESFKDFSTNPKRLKHPLRLLTEKQMTEFAKELHVTDIEFKKYLNEYLANENVNEFRFTNFEEEKHNLFNYISNTPENMPF